MRSRCAGSMLAWILKTTPVNLGSSGCTTRWIAVRTLGDGARSTSASSTSCTPKLLTAEPKNIGVWWPARKASRSNGRRGVAQQLDLALRLLVLHAEARRVGRVVEAVEELLAVVRLRAAEQAHALFAQVHHAVKGLAHADRPGEGHDLHAEFALDLVHQRHRLLHLAVHLVDEGQDRRVARAADLQAAGASAARRRWPRR